jgi:hypothetical protein
MKRLIPFVLLLLPAALFAQSFKDQDAAVLKKLGLNDSQVSQVRDIQGKTRATVRQEAVQIRLLRAQMEKALLPANPNMQDVNGYITQISAARADLMKAFVGARVQLRQIIGDDNFPAYARYLRQRSGLDGRRGFLQMRQRAPGNPVPGDIRGGVLGGDGPLMGDHGAMMGDANGDESLVD